ncbi:hypothetical protein CJ430_28890 [Klebsiella pneumoniae]|nr:hypothetical protein CJ430_28890 [Klebsiella pneumoniae]
MITHLEYQHDESLLLNYKFLASNLTSIPIIQNLALLQIVGGDKLIIPFADGAAHEPIQRPAFSA